jgi:hypothetical protein
MGLTTISRCMQVDTKKAFDRWFGMILWHQLLETRLIQFRKYQRKIIDKPMIDT